jgi:cell division protein FtsZ
MFDAPTQPDAASEEAMDLGGAEIVEEVEAEVVEPQPVPPVAPAAPVARFDDIDGNDELLLGAETAVQPASAPQPAPAAPAAAAKPAGTLFERMSGLSRGLGRGQSADDEDDDGPTVTKFPQFLNRQGNQ